MNKADFISFTGTMDRKILVAKNSIQAIYETTDAPTVIVVVANKEFRVMNTYEEVCEILFPKITVKSASFIQKK